MSKFTTCCGLSTVEACSHS